MIPRPFRSCDGVAREQRAKARLGIDRHRTELQAIEWPAIPPDTAVREKDRAAVLSDDCQRDDDKEGQKEEQRKNDNREIHESDERIIMADFRAGARTSGNAQPFGFERDFGHSSLQKLTEITFEPERLSVPARSRSR